jgi:hypothetical protein
MDRSDDTAPAEGFTRCGTPGSPIIAHDACFVQYNKRSAMNCDTPRSSDLARRPDTRARRRALHLLLFYAALASAGASHAFTFADGTTMHCFAAGQPVKEYDAPPEHRLVVDNHIGLVEPDGAGYRIAWNAAMLQSLPPEVHDFIFFHECAHASVPTQDELTANCVGLKVMRAAGRAGFAVEAKLGAFYGRGSEYWRKTVACADTGENPPASSAPR